MRTSTAVRTGLIAGAIAALAMTVTMLILWSVGIATPLAIIGDRLSVFIKPGPFLRVMGLVGGYNHLKQLGVGSTMAGQLVFGALGGAFYGLVMRKTPARASVGLTFSVFVLLPLVAVAIFLWPVLGTSYRGLPIAAARVVTLIGFALSVLVYERTLVACFHLLTRARPQPEGAEFTPPIARRGLILGSLGLVLAGGGLALLRRLYQVASFSYDGTQYKGAAVQPITPNDQFYCVTKNVVDPGVDEDLWHLEVDGLVANARTYSLDDLKGFPAVEQETTLMCISNGLEGGLMSNAKWRGLTLRDLLEPAAPLAGATKVRLHGVDNYTDTFPLEKALNATTLLAYEMNGEPLPDRHGFPMRAIVPGYFGEKQVKWLTRIEVAKDDAKGFYEKQGWGPDFIVPTRSRIDGPESWSTVSLGELTQPIEVKGVAFGGDRGITKVEWSYDAGQTWLPADIYYNNGPLAWVLWRAAWKPDQPGEYTLVVRATDGKGDVQSWESDRGPYSGTAGLHSIGVSIKA